MAEEGVGWESLLSRAKEQENGYDWTGAIATYSSLLGRSSGKDDLKTGRIKESIAYASYRAAFQSESVTEFRTGLDQAIANYEKALESYGKSGGPKASPYKARCQAMIEFIGFWQAQGPPVTRQTLTEAWRLARESMIAFEREREPKEFLLTWNSMWWSAIYMSWFAVTSDGWAGPQQDVVDLGERAVSLLPEKGNESDLAAAHVCIGILQHRTIYNVRVDHQKKDIGSRALSHWEDALRLSRDRATVELSNLCSNDNPFGLAENQVLSLLEKALADLRATRDKHKIGCALLSLAYQSEWLLNSIEDSDELNTQAERTLRYAREASDSFAHFSPSNVFLLHWFLDPEAEIASVLTAGEMDLVKKRALAEKALSSAVYLTACERQELPTSAMFAKIVRAFSLNELSKTEKVPERKRAILQEAIELGKSCVQSIERLQPNFNFNRGMWLNNVAEAQCELACLSEDAAEKLRILKEGISNLSSSLALAKKDLDPSLGFVRGDWGALGAKQFRHGKWLMRLAELEGGRKNFEDAAAVFEDCAATYGRAGMVSRVAECDWMAAQIHDSIGEYSKGSDRFLSASKNYKLAAGDYPGLKELYNDHSQYMQAWHSIEEARYRHSRQEHGLARDAYKVAAERHRSTKRWSHMSTNYLALAAVEDAEDLSRKDRIRESIEAFRGAARLFDESVKQLTSGGAGTDTIDERQMLQRLIDSADQRQALCKARIALEEARLLDREGNLDSASERYGLVSEMFSKMKDGLGSDEDKKDTDLMIVLSKAWKVMAKAEAESSPELYEEAAKLFEEAKNLSPGEKAKSLAMGHGRLSMALAAGARYADTGDPTFHAAAVKSLESAAKYYLKADQQTAVEYVKGSKLLFDGYDYMNRASSESDEQKKTKLYSMAEKVLQASASSFEKAGQHGREEQVLKLLAKVKEDRELAVSLVEVFTAPDMVSAAMVFSSPTPKHETAVGLDRFEHADVQVTLITNPTTLHVGQELSMEMELVNAGRGSAQLVKVEGIVPEGFEIVEKPEKCRIEDKDINLRGRRLDALKTEIIQLVLRPTTRGDFKFKPRVKYQDESGTSKTCEPTPVEVKVTEMGISGWLRGT